MKRAWIIFLVVTACRQQPPPAEKVPVVDGIPEALLYPGPALRHARTRSGMAVALHDSEGLEPGAAALLLPRGWLHDGETPGAAAMTAAVLKRAGLSALSPAGPIQGDDLDLALESRGIELDVTAESEHLLLRASGPVSETPGMVTVLCGVAFTPSWSEDVLDAAYNELMDASDERAHGTNGLTDEILRAELFRGHPLERPLIPDEEALTSMQVADVSQWLFAATDPEGALLIVAGGDARAVMDAAELCARRDAPVKTAPIPAPAPRVSTDIQRIHVELEGGDTAYVRVGSRGPPSGTVDALAVGVVMEALANGFSSRLVTRLRTDRGLVYGVEGGLVGSRSAGVWAVSTSTSREHAREVAETMERVLDELYATGISDEEFRKLAHANALAFAYGREAVTELMSVELDDFILGLPPNGLWRTPSMLWSLDGKAAWARVRPYFDPAQRVVVIAAHEDVIPEEIPHRIIDANEWP